MSKSKPVRPSIAYKQLLTEALKWCMSHLIMLLEVGCFDGNGQLNCEMNKYRLCFIFCLVVNSHLKSAANFCWIESQAVFGIRSFV